MQFLLTIFGYTVFFGLIYFAWNTQSYRWRILAKEYASGEKVAPIARKYMRAVILFGRKPMFNSYMGITTVTVGSDKLELRLMPPFNWLHQPLAIPFAHLKASQCDWYLNSPSFELVASQASEIRIVVDGELLDWIATNAPDWNAEDRYRW